ncbi:MAG: hypothetical protein JWO56_3759, partial [Acidobacteria bacterium]|nr:hypothetical protein [Acidobacteriota bacterium]
MSSAQMSILCANQRENTRAEVQGDPDVYLNSADLLIPYKSTGTTTIAGAAYKSGNGTTSSRKAYVTVESLETTAQKWLAGMNGATSFVIRDATAAIDRLSINTAGVVGSLLATSFVKTNSTPAAGTTHNYAIASGAVLLGSGAVSAITFTGFSAPFVSATEITPMTIINLSGQTVTLNHNDGGSLAPNRIWTKTSL